MPYIENSMSQFNKNNPYVVLAKQEYDNINKMLQAMSKYIVKYLISIIGPFVVSIAALILSFIYGNYITSIISASSAFLIFIVALIYYINYKKKIEYYLLKAPGMIEFSRLSEMEMSDIIKIGSEDVLHCLHMMYEMKGGLVVETRNFRVLGNKLFGFSIFCCLVCAVGLALKIYGG